MTFNKYLSAVISLVLLVAFTAPTAAQTCLPTATFTYTNDEGQEITETAESYSGSAPVKVEFKANPVDADDYTARFEWIIYETGKENNILVHRFEQDIEYTFLHSGSFTVELKATFSAGSDETPYPAEGEAPARFTVSVSESRLEMPNAFSPNDDSRNDTYKVKNHQSIVEFHATIFNRWGQKLYSWDDVNGEWDGKVNGKVVNDGVYFVNVSAKGADGRVYHIRKDINVLTRFTNSDGSSSTK